jgi:murein DD-endopeptidase MepM/ murein hydrolase activator NlpD
MITKHKTSKLFTSLQLLLIPSICFLLMAFSTKLRLKNDSQGQPSISPVELARVTNFMGYGNCINPKTNKKDFHFGIDFQMEEGEPVMSTETGTVIESLNDKTKGNYVVIKHSEIYSTEYYHLKNSSVKKGDKLNKGQVIGYVGHSGIAEGDHLHYEVHKQGKHVNPKDYLPGLIK